MKKLNFAILVLGLAITIEAFSDNGMPICEDVAAWRQEVWNPKTEPCFGTIEKHVQTEYPQRIIGEFYPSGRRKFLNVGTNTEDYILIETDDTGKTIKFISGSDSQYLKNYPRTLEGAIQAEPDTFNSIWEGIERRKNWLYKVKSGMSKLPICEGPIRKWDKCFEMTREECGNYIGEWRAGKKYGKGSEKSLSGDRFDGEYKNDWDANGVVNYTSGNKYSGDVKIDCGKFRPNGQGVYSENGVTLSGSWVDDYPEGFLTLQYPKDPKFKYNAYSNQYVRGVPIFNTKSCLQKTEGEIIGNLGVPEKAYEADGKKYLSYNIRRDYNFEKESDYQYTCTAYFDAVFTVVSGKVVSARDSNLNFGSKFNACTGKFNLGKVYLDDYGCYK